MAMTRAYDFCEMRVISSPILIANGSCGKPQQHFGISRSLRASGRQVGFLSTTSVEPFLLSSRGSTMKSFLNHLCHKGNRKWRFVANLLLATGYCSLAAAADLPEVSDRQPVPLSHFPDTLHAVVWRNWGLVP